MIPKLIDLDFKTVKIRYIYHSCFLIESLEFNLVIDYWREIDENDNADNTLPSFLKELDLDKPLYVLVSHHHKDHFNKNIFMWKSCFKKIRYILSYDVAKMIKYIFNPLSNYQGRFKMDSDLITILSPGDTYQDANFKVHAFNSSDVGCCFLITLPSGDNIFHAGDYNDWTFKSESTLSEIIESESQFHKVLDDILSFLGEDFSINVTLFPLDPRLGCSINDGADQFLHSFNVDNLIPMHFAPSILRNNPGHAKNEKLLRTAIEMLRLSHPSTHFHDENI